ncbi:MAG: cation diffusion facilitator family transporter [Acidobacteriota bacterium]
MHIHPKAHRVDAQQGRRRPQERRGLLFALALTGAILVAEAIGGYLANSLALMADAGHMLTDALALGLAFLAVGFATRPATAEKSYGWYRVEILAALVNGVTLVVISLFIFWEAYDRLIDPPVVATRTMLVIATIGLLANGVGLRFLSGHGPSLNVRGAYLHMVGDLISSVGVIVGGVIMSLTDNYLIDPLLSAIIGVVIVVSAYRLLREAVDVLLEATPVGVDLDDVGRALALVEGVEGAHDLHIWSLTSGLHALSCHVEVKVDNLSQADAILDRINSVLQARFGITHTTIQIESESYKQRGLVHWRLPGPQRAQ